MSAEAPSSADGLKDVPDPVSAPRLLIGVALGPAAWIAQLVICYGVAGYACFGGDAPRPGAGPAPPAWEFGLLLAVNLACLIVAIVGAALSAANLHKVDAPAPGGPESLPAITRRRIQFIAACGVMTCLGAVLATMFAAPQIFLTPACWGPAS
jgi:hypothetical protein